MTVASNTTAAVASIGPVRVAARTWRGSAGLQLTVVVKALFGFRHNAAMELLDAPPLVMRDQHIYDDPTRSLLAASDVVPFRRSADIWLTGHAYATAGTRVGVAVARLGLYRANETVLEKTVHIVGDRVRAGAPPAPFERMPLTYERAYGGIGFDGNPVGVGADERPLLPNVLHPTDQNTPACFAPLSRYWKVRRQRVDPNLRKRIERSVAEIPQKFDWNYFQAAPEDQRVRYLMGDEWLVLDGMNASLLRVQTRLPKVTGVARLMPRDQRSDDRGDVLVLSADTMAIDTDRQTCAVCWRATCPLVSEQALEDLLIAGSVCCRGERTDWEQAYNEKRAVRLYDTEAQVTMRAPTSLEDSGVTMVSNVQAIGPSESNEDLASTTVDEYPFGQSSTFRNTRRSSSEPANVEETAAPVAIDTKPDSLPAANPWEDDESTGGERARIMPFGGPVPADTLKSAVSEDAGYFSDAGSSGASSAPPAPLDNRSYAAALRRAGASEADVEALLSFLSKR